MELLTAQRKGEPFDPDSGLPQSMEPVIAGVTRLAHAQDFVGHKWVRASARHRRGIAEALATVTMVLWTSERGAADPDKLRDVLRNWAFNMPGRIAPGADTNTESKDEVPDDVRWALTHSCPSMP